MDRHHGDTIQQQTVGGHFRRGPLRSLAAFALSLIVIFGSGGISVVAQAGDTAFSDKRYVSELSDLEVLVRGDFVIMATGSTRYAYGEAEIINMATPESFFSGSVLADVGFFDDTDTPAATLEFIKNDMYLVMDSFDVLREGPHGYSCMEFRHRISGR